MTTIIQAHRSIFDLLRSYYQLSKPRIVALLIFTTITAMFIAAQGFPPIGLLVYTTIGGSAAAAGASALNQYIDREMDGKMKRTASRPIPSGRVSPTEALAYGVVVIVFAVLWLGLLVNWLAALLSLAGAIYYVVFYTLLLKRNTSVNIVIGGGAGAMPVLVGWAAQTGGLSIAAWILFGIVFYWTPPHSWALALIVNKQYASVGVPMMPVARGEAATHRQIVLYSVLLVVFTLLPISIQMLGIIYTVSAAILGGFLVYLAIRLMRNPGKEIQWRMWKYSTYYLALLFLVMIVDSVIGL